MYVMYYWTHFFSVNQNEKYNKKENYAKIQNLRREIKVCIPVLKSEFCAKM